MVLFPFKGWFSSLHLIQIFFWKPGFPGLLTNPNAFVLELFPNYSGQCSAYETLFPGSQWQKVISMMVRVGAIIVLSALTYEPKGIVGIP